MTSEQLGTLLPLLLLVVVFWLLILRPARRRQQEAARLQGGLAVGDRVMLSSGIFGTVVALADETFDVDVAAGVVLTVARPAVARVVPPDDAPGESEPEPDSADWAADERRAKDDGGDARP